MEQLVQRGQQGEVGRRSYLTYHLFHAWVTEVLDSVDEFAAKHFVAIATKDNATSKILVHRIDDDLVAARGLSATTNFIHQPCMNNTLTHIVRTWR